MNANLSFDTHAVFSDQFGRQKRKLRISVTDRCNFKCVYCMPEHPEWIKKHHLLSFEELYQFCFIMVRQGIQHIRITGGEPLMRKGIVHFVESLQQLKKVGLKRISMTTNAHYLNQYAEPLKKAGLDDLNISLDSLDAEQFKALTQKDLAAVFEGIQAAQSVGLPIKINTVLIKGINENQIVPLAKWSIQNNVILRFIEFMPLDGDEKWLPQHVVSEQYILDVLSTAFKLEVEQTCESNANPARQYLIDQHPIGIISTISHSFCADCDRIRLTAQGELYNCLFAPQGLALKNEIKLLASPSSNLDQKELHTAVLLEKVGHYIWRKESGFDAIRARTKQQASRKISMHMLGG